MKDVPTLDYPFSSADLEAAYKEWGCNCGPSALAFALQLPVDRVRGAIPEFTSKRYTSPTMMKQGLASLGAAIDVVRNPMREDMFHERPALVRIQWTGPWTAPGSNPRWGYWHTHWVATWMVGLDPKLFDCNGGIMGLTGWEAEIVPLITGEIKRADGGWFPTHVWRLAG